MSLRRTNSNTQCASPTNDYNNTYLIRQEASSGLLSTWNAAAGLDVTRISNGMFGGTKLFVNYAVIFGEHFHNCVGA